LDGVIESVVYDLVPNTGGSDSVSYISPSLGDVVADSYDTDIFGFFRMADPGTAPDQSQIDAAYEQLQSQYPDSIKVVGSAPDAPKVPVARFIKSAFVPTEALDIKKQFVAEDTEAVGFGDEVQIIVTVKNVSQERITNLQILDDNPPILAQE